MSTATFESINTHLISVYLCILTCYLISADAYIQFISKPLSIRQGQNFILTCNYPNGNAKYLKIRPGQREFIRINDTAIGLNIYDTHQFGRLVGYECMLNDSVVSHLDIHVYRKMEVIDFDCFILLEPNQNVTCEIILPHNPEKGVHYNLRRVSPLPDKNLNCVTIDRRMKCDFEHLYNRLGVDITKNENYVFNLTLIDGLNGTFKLFSMEKNAMVKVPAPTILSDSINSTEICLIIFGDNISDLFVDWQVEWNIEVKNISDKPVHFSHMNCKIPNGLWPKKQNITCCLGDLYPYHLYNISVSRRFAGGSNAHWSNTTTKLLQTSSDVPAQPPYSQSNWFTYESDEETLTIYWKQLSEDQKNGANFRYIINILGNKRPDFIGSNSATIRNWSVDESYNISIRSSNDYGMSVNSTILIIPRLEDESSLQQLSIKFNRDTSILSWYFNDLALDISNLEGFTVFWCRPNRTAKNRCLESESIEYKNINATQKTYNFDSLYKYEYIAIGIAANFKLAGKSAGIKWVPIDYDVESNNKDQRYWPLYMLACLLTILFGILAFSVYKKLQKMADIKVVLPVFRENALRNGCPTQIVIPNQRTDEDSRKIQFIVKDEPISKGNNQIQDVRIKTDRNNYIAPRKNVQSFCYTVMNNKN